MVEEIDINEIRNRKVCMGKQRVRNFIFMIFLFKLWRCVLFEVIYQWYLEDKNGV